MDLTDSSTLFGGSLADGASQQRPRGRQPPSQ